MRLKFLIALLASTLWCSWAQAQQIVPVTAGVITADVSGGQNAFKSVINAAVTSVMFKNPTPGQVITFLFQENATGGFAVTFGGNISSPCTVSTAANATTNCSFQYDSTSNTWFGAGGSSSSASPGIFNSNFDPPLFQNYSLTTTGAQTGINLTANPIDTHTITWRPSGTVTTCTVALDTSADGVSWTAGGAIAGQTCTAAGQLTATTKISSNFVRVNLTTLTGGGTLTVVYSGRFAPAPPVPANPVENGIGVTTSDVLWSQLTSQSISSVSTVGNVSWHNMARIRQADGSILAVTWDVAGCAMVTSGGYGAGLLSPVNGTLVGITSYITAPATIPNGAVYMNQYVLTSMPSGGSSTVCSSNLVSANIGTLLTGAPVGSFYPMSWPGSGIVSVESVPPIPMTVGVTNPAAGAEFLYNPNPAGGNGHRTCITGVFFQLATSATAGTRQVALRFLDNSGGNGVQLFWISSTTQGPSSTVLYSFAPGTTQQQATIGATTIQTVPFANGPPVCFAGTLDTNSRLSSFSNVQTGDQFSSIFVRVTVLPDQD